MEYVLLDQKEMICFDDGVGLTELSTMLGSSVFRVVASVSIVFETIVHLIEKNLTRHTNRHDVILNVIWVGEFRPVGMS